MGPLQVQGRQWWKKQNTQKNSRQCDKKDLGTKPSSQKIRSHGHVSPSSRSSGVVKPRSSNSTSLQCYSVLSTIAQVLRKMILKILASSFLMPYLSQTFESHQSVIMSIFSVNDLGLKKILK